MLSGGDASKLVGRAMFASLTLWILGIVLSLPFEGRLRAQATTAATQLENLSAQATEAQKRGNYREAAEAYQQVLRLRPDLIGARLNLGLMQFSMKDYAAAIETFEAVLHENPKSFPGNLFLGLSLLGQEKAEHAVAYLKRAQSLDPRNAETLLALGQAYSILRDYPQANDSYYELTRVKPQSADAWYGLGVSYLALSREAARQLPRTNSALTYSQLLMAESIEQQSRREDAVKLYKTLATTTPPFPCYRAAVGLGLARLGEIDSSEQLFQVELKHNPGCLPARMGLARVAIEHGSFARAMKSFEELWALDPAFVEANASSALTGLVPAKMEAFQSWLQDPMNGGSNGSGKVLADLLLATLKGTAQGEGEGSLSPITADLNPLAETGTKPALLFSEGRYSQCTQNLRTKIEKLALADLLMLARCAFYSGDYRTSFLSSGRAMETSPENLEGSYWRIRTAEMLASSSWLRTSLLNPNSAKLHILLADAYREGEHFAEAEGEYRKAIQISPRDFAARFGLATAFYQDFRIDQAADELKEALDLKPGDPDASYLMGGILVLRRQYDAAKPLLLVGLKGNPSNVPHVYALLGKVDAAQGQFVEARVELEKSLDADNDGSYHYQLSRVYMQLGDKQAAAAALAQSEAIRKASARRAENRLGLPQLPRSDRPE
jgi:tetratricopeptide (TPR) repeat protein